MKSIPAGKTPRIPFLFPQGHERTTNQPSFLHGSYDEYSDGESNHWSSSSDDTDGENEEDWEDSLRKRQEPSTWESSDEDVASNEDDDNLMTMEASSGDPPIDDDGGDAWLDTLQAVAADEVEFMNKENQRADAVRQMQEWGFDAKQIEDSLGVATTDDLERDGGMMDQFLNVTAESGFGMMVNDVEVDLSTIESHTTVEVDEETGDPIRSQMVYVDEHTCIGCTNCAMIAPSTFFMEDYIGRARVFDQWGDDDETIEVAIATCPVDCIHYVPYEELVKLEIERRDQNINFKAKLVNQDTYGGSAGHRVGSAAAFTGPQEISGNMLSRCNNCPSSGCKNCPMYGVGKNPEFERKEAIRKKKREERLRKQAMESANKSFDL